MATLSSSKSAHGRQSFLTQADRPLSVDRQLSFSQERPSYIKTSCHLTEAPEMDFPFHPQINQLPTSLYKNRSKIDISRQEQFQRLLDNRKEENERRLKDKIRQEQEQIQKHCTFKPQINQGDIQHEAQIHQRLYQEGIERMKYREMARVNTQKENYSFQPQINKTNLLNSEKTNLQPLYKRLAEQIKKEREYRQMLKKNLIEAEMEECKPARPLPKSCQILQNKTDFCKNVVERLMKEVRNRQHRRQQLIEQQEQKEKQELTFAPQINPISLGLTQMIGVKDDFVRRQEILADQLKRRMEMRAREILYENATFKPSINKVSEMLANMHRLEQNPDEKIERLHNDTVRQVKLQEIECETYKQCTFQPEINIISKQLEANPVHHCCDRPHEPQYNFKPQINQKSREMARNTSRKNDSSEMQVEKMKMEMEYEKFKECTFKPKIKPYVSRSEKCLSQVSGIDNWIKMAQNKKKKQQQQKIIEEKLFCLEKKYDQRGEKLTRINQFNLSRPNVKVKQELKEEQLKQMAKQCTFKPNINRNRLTGPATRLLY